MIRGAMGPVGGSPSEPLLCSQEQGDQPVKVKMSPGNSYNRYRLACATLVAVGEAFSSRPSSGVEGSLISLTMQTRVSLFELMPGGHGVL
jgi:hypothetical protein